MKFSSEDELPFLKPPCHCLCLSEASRIFVTCVSNYSITRVPGRGLWPLPDHRRFLVMLLWCMAINSNADIWNNQHRQNYFLPNLQPFLSSGLPHDRHLISLIAKLNLSIVRRKIGHVTLGHRAPILIRILVNAHVPWKLKMTSNIWMISRLSALERYTPSSVVI